MLTVNYLSTILIPNYFTWINSYLNIKVSFHNNKIERMGSKPSVEMRGDENAKHYVLVNYCGGWGYYNYAAAIADRIEAKYPGQFKFELLPDDGTTGRLEVTIFFNSGEKAEKGGVVIHSKAGGDG